MAFYRIEQTIALRTVGGIMLKYAYSGFLLVFLLVGCTSISDYRKIDQLDEANRVFKNAMIWSEFQTAAAFLAPKQAAAVDLDKLKNVKVTNYNVKKVIISEPKTRVGQIVEISYYKKDVMIERTVTDNQLWEYDDAQAKWVLTSGFPEFK
jgi:hypothetical protein